MLSVEPWQGARHKASPSTMLAGIIVRFSPMRYPTASSSLARVFSVFARARPALGESGGALSWVQNVECQKP